MIPRYSLPEMSAVWDDARAFQIWLEVEVAVCEALAQTGVMEQKDLELIKRNARFDRAEYDRQFAETKHDLVSFVRAVSKTLGDEGRWIHYGLTSNDVKDTALSIQLRESCSLLRAKLEGLMTALARRAHEFKDTPAMGRSHGMHAEPMSFGAKFALWWSEMQRNMERLDAVSRRAAVCKISGPVGSHATSPPEVERIVAERLGLTPAAMTNQVVQRDIHAEYAQLLALMGAGLEQIATEVRHLQRSEVAEAMEPFGREGFVSKGSSSMPHKRNPELSERICGLARLLRGYASAALENVALWHERDISHSSAERVGLPDASLALDYMLHLAERVVDGLVVNQERIAANLESARGLPFSPRVMLALVESGMPRSEAYDLVQGLTMQALDQGADLRDLLRGSQAVTNALTPEGLEKLFDYKWYLRHVDEQFRTLGI